jgi:hypothetical protein
LLVDAVAGDAEDGDVASQLRAASGATAEALDRTWTALQRFVRTLPEEGGQVLVELPSPPFKRGASLVETCVSHAIVGLLRALSADDGRDNVRFNALVRADARPATLDAVREYLLDASAAWINGHVFVLEGDSVSVVAAESARWQAFCDAREAGWADFMKVHVLAGGH